MGNSATLLFMDRSVGNSATLLFMDRSVGNSATLLFMDRSVGNSATLLFMDRSVRDRCGVNKLFQQLNFVLFLVFNLLTKAESPACFILQ
ncbi:hypothetical protein [Leptospira interrogans]|uniref:hypothetical protein n=1 Tax=Leptospira interrogans TaxID=173 RepID=UPI0012B5B292|nr:hypothetical protein [Leptospira interrogans]